MVPKTQSVKPARRESSQKAEDESQEITSPTSKDTTEIDALLDEIEEVLEENDIDAKRRRAFREKLKSLSLIGRRVCSEPGTTIRVPGSQADAILAAGFKEAGPPCIDC